MTEFAVLLFLVGVLVGMAGMAVFDRVVLLPLAHQTYRRAKSSSRRPTRHRG